MAAGKSSVGAHLAERLGLPFTDTDALVEQRAGLSVAAVFAALGEPAFRAIEADVVVDALVRPGVVALGGGSLEDDRVLRACLAQPCTLVFLDVGPAVAASRILADPGRRRPLYEQGGIEALEALDARRRARWAQAAFRVDATAGTAAEIADRIAHELT